MKAVLSPQNEFETKKCASVIPQKYFERKGTEHKYIRYHSMSLSNSSAQTVLYNSFSEYVNFNSFRMFNYF